jgi:S-DNA-T family DNA segregation ATPase FtsK/SpoIIIE
MQARAGRFAGKQRDHTPTIEHPFVVVLVDEVAFLTAYQPDRKLRERDHGRAGHPDHPGPGGRLLRGGGAAGPAQGRADLRNLFPDRIAMRLDEPEQVDMVLGDGARDRGATCD